MRRGGQPLWKPSARGLVPVPPPRSAQVVNTEIYRRWQKSVSLLTARESHIFIDPLIEITIPKRLFRCVFWRQSEAERGGAQGAGTRRRGSQLYQEVYIGVAKRLLGNSCCGTEGTHTSQRGSKCATSRKYTNLNVRKVWLGVRSRETRSPTWEVTLGFVLTWLEH